MTVLELQKKYLPSITPEDFFVLLAHATHKEKIYLLAHPEYELPEPARVVAIDSFVRRQKHEPVAYITGLKAFYGRDFHVTKDTLIPRPETEHLIESTLNTIFNFQFSIFKNIDIIDVGTGSGNIIITLATELASSSQDIHFFGIDVSPEALAIARHNADTHHVLKNILFTESDLLTRVPLPQEKNHHLIVTANLPYLSHSIYTASPSDVRDYEPEQALVSGVDGLDHYRHLLHTLAERKKHYRSLSFFLEISPEQNTLIQQEILHFFPTSILKVIPDLSGRDRLIQASIL